MTAKDRQTITMTPEAREDSVVVAKYLGLVRGGEVINWSAVAHHALKVAAVSVEAGEAPPQRPRRAGGGSSRLERAMTKAGLTGPDVARSLGCHRATIAHVLRGGLALDLAAGGALLAWVEQQERG